MPTLGEPGENGRVHPELELGARHIDSGVRKDRCVVRGLAHKSEDMVWMEMRNDYPRNLCGLDSGCSHIGDHGSGRRLKLTTRAGVEENRVVAELDQSYVKRNGHDFIRNPSGSQCGLGFLNGHVRDERRIMRFLPNAIVQDATLDLVELEWPEPLAGFRSLLGERSLDERDRLGQAERCSCACCRQQSVTAGLI